MSEISASLLNFLCDWSIRWGGLILGLAAWFWLMPPRSIAHRLLLGRLVLLAGLLMPFTPKWLSIPWVASTPPIEIADASSQAERTAYPDLGTMSQPSPLELVPSSGSQATLHSDRTGIPQRISDSMPIQTSASNETETNSAPSTHWNVSILLASIWVIGAGYCLIRLGISLWILERIKSRAKSPSDRLSQEWRQIQSELAIQRKVPLLASAEVNTPALLGGWNPKVLVPLDWESVPPAAMRAAFLHEWTHIQHRDDWAKWFEELIRAFFFFHPFVHWLTNRIHLDREQRCDAQVVSHGINPREMAALLLQQCKRLQSSRCRRIAAPALSFFQLNAANERIFKLLEVDMNRWNSPVTRSSQLAALLLVFGCTLGLGGLRIAGATYLETTAAPVPENKDLVEIAGMVYLPNGEPADATTIWAASSETIGAVRPKTFSQKDGSFRLSLPKGQWRIRAARGSMGGEPVGNTWLGNEVVIAPPEKPDPISISLEAGGIARGKLVEEESGKPVVHASIHHNNGFIATTDQNGGWELPGLTRGAQQIVILAPGRQASSFQFDTMGKPITELNLQLRAGRSIKGTVQDEKGNAVPGAWVGRSVGDGMLSGQGGYVACDRLGHFEYFCGAGETTLSASAPGYSSEYKTVAAKDAGTASPVAFQLKSRPVENTKKPPEPLKTERVVVGSIRLPDGRPASGVYCRWGLLNLSNAPTCRTDNKGLFRLIVPREENYLTVIPKGYQPELISVAMDGNQNFPIKLKQGETTTGTVVDSFGNPISGVAILPMLRNPNPRMGDQVSLSENSTVSDRHGRFTIHGIPGNCHFFIGKNGYSSLRDYSLDVNQPSLTVRLDRHGFIKGRVVDAAGKPVQNFRITMQFPTTRIPNAKLGMIPLAHSVHGIWFTSDDGAFVVSDLEPGTVWKVQAFAKGLGRAVVEHMEAVPFDQLEQIQPILVKGQAAVDLKVQVSDTEGQPIPHARAVLIDGRLDLDRAFSWQFIEQRQHNQIVGKADAKGLVHFPDLPITEGTIFVQAPGFARQKFGWRENETRFDLVLKKEAVIVGKVEIPAEWLARHWYVKLTSQTNDTIALSIPAKDQGAFVVRELAAGTWDLEVGPQGTIGVIASPPTNTIRQTIELKPGQVLKWKGDWKAE